MTTAKVKDDFLQTLEDGVRAVINDEKSTPKDRIEAINAGTKVMQIKHKIGSLSDKEDNYFGSKK